MHNSRTLPCVSPPTVPSDAAWVGLSPAPPLGATTQALMTYLHISTLLQGVKMRNDLSGGSPEAIGGSPQTIFTQADEALPPEPS